MNTKFASGYDPGSNGLQYYSAAQFVAGSPALIKAFGSEIDNATGAFVNDIAACGCPGKTGIRTDVVTGKLKLDNFNENAYYRRLSSGVQRKFNDLLTGNPDLNKADTLAMYNIAETRTWSKIDKEKYLFSNSDLIDRFGSPSKALKQARNHYLQKGFFQQRSLNNDDLYNAYVQTYPNAMFDSGATFLDENSLAHYFVKSGYESGQRIPATVA